MLNHMMSILCQFSRLIVVAPVHYLVWNTFASYSLLLHIQILEFFYMMTYSSLASLGQKQILIYLKMFMVFVNISMANHPFHKSKPQLKKLKGTLSTETITTGNMWLTTRYKWLKMPLLP